MKNSYHSVETVLEYLEATGALGPALRALAAMLLAAGVLLFVFWLFRSFKIYRSRGGIRGARTRRKVGMLRAQGHLEGEFTFADAVEMTQTGTIRKKSLEDKIATCVEPVELLFDSIEHGVVYHFESGSWSEKEVASWLEVSRALGLGDLSKILEELVHMRGVVCHPQYDPNYMQNGEILGDRLWRRGKELRAEVIRIDGVARLRDACETHLRRHAPHMLPI